MLSRLVRLGTGLAVAGTAHAALNARLIRRPDPSARPSAHRVSLLVPARDEAENVPGLLASFWAQDDPDLEILVLDDASTDGTGAAVAGGDDRRVRVIRGADLPEWWLGKTWACAQLAAAARPESDVLVFTDADVRLCPGAVAGAVALLDDAGLDYVSPHPRQEAVTVPERLVQPLLQWSFMTTLPLRLAERAPFSSMAAANGQFIAVRRAAYERAGGHAAVRADVLDDIGLAHALRTAGSPGAMADGSAVAECRMYADWASIRSGYSKSLWKAFGSSPGALAVLSWLFLAYVLPPLAALFGSRVGLLGYLAGVAGRVISARATRGRALPDAFAHPLSVVAFGTLVVHSLREHRHGHLTWKGRALPR